MIIEDSHWRECSEGSLVSIKVTWSATSIYLDAASVPAESPFSGALRYAGMHYFNC